MLNLMSPEDKIVVITCKEPKINLDNLNDEVTEKCKEYNRNTHEHAILEREPGQSIYQSIKKYLVELSDKDNYVDFVGVGNAGQNFSSKNSKDYLGSVASMVLRAKRMNCVFVP